MYSRLIEETDLRTSIKFCNLIGFKLLINCVIHIELVSWRLSKTKQIVFEDPKSSAGNNFSYLKGHVSSQTFILKGHIRKLVEH